jgi:voltage-gated potassium channel
MTDLIVKFAYNTESSKTYHRFRTFLVNILQNNTTSKKIFDLVMVFLVISTVGILIYEVKHTVPDFLNQYEYFAVGIFILEWIGRFIINFESHKQIIRDFEESQFLNIDYDLSQSIKIIISKKLQYIFSLASIVDLLAILPSYRPLRILRIFLLFRLFKVLRYSNSLHQFVRVFVEKKLELTLLLMLYLLVIFFCSTILYIYEGNGINQHIHSFLDAIYWSFITVSTIGYGDITPVTDTGKAITLVLILTGYAVIAFFTSIVTSSISDKLDLIKETDTLSNISKLKQYILVCGYGKSGQILVDNLKSQDYHTLIIDTKEENILKAEAKNLHIVKDDASDISLLRKIDINKNVQSIVVLTDDDTLNLSIILAIRSLNKSIPIMARSNRFKTQDKLKLAGATKIISINETASLVALGHLRAPIAFEAMENILVDYHGASMSEIEIFHTSPFIGRKLSDVDFDRFNINFIGIVHNEKQNNFIFNPIKEDIILLEKDFLIIIGYARTIKNFQSYLQSHKWNKG